jgi:hypothetical protein
MKPIKSTPKPLNRTLQPIDREAMKARMMKRPKLGFIVKEPNPLQGMPRDLPAEEQFQEVTKRLEGGLSAAMKKQAEQFDSEGRSDYYAVLCFEQGEQLDAFLKGLKYPEPDAVYIDGPLLARCAGIPIPEPEFRLKPLRAPDKSLARLVTVTPKRVQS